MEVRLHCCQMRKYPTGINNLHEAFFTQSPIFLCQWQKSSFTKHFRMKFVGNFCCALKKASKNLLATLRFLPFAFWWSLMKWTQGQQFDQHFLKFCFRSGRPSSDSDLANLLRPTSDKIAEIQSHRESRCQFHKHFTLVNYSCCKISWCILKTFHGWMQVMSSSTAYFARVVSYIQILFIKLTTAVNFTSILHS